MATKKNAAKKAAPKKAAIKLVDPVMYVISKRNGWFSWTPVQVFPTRELANSYRELYEELSDLGKYGYKVDRVDLVNAPIDETKDFILTP